MLSRGVQLVMLCALTCCHPEKRRILFSRSFVLWQVTGASRTLVTAKISVLFYIFIPLFSNSRLLSACPLKTQLRLSDLFEPPSVVVCGRAGE